MGFIKKLLGIYNVTEKALMSMLRDIKIFSSFPEKKLYELSKKFKLSKYNGGTMLIQEGNGYGKIGLLENGEISVWKTSDGNKIKLGNINKGEIFGEMAYFLKTKPMASLVCDTNCIIWEATYEDFTQLMQENPDIFEEIKVIINKRYQNNLKTIQTNYVVQTPHITTKEEGIEKINTIKVNI